MCNDTRKTNNKGFEMNIDNLEQESNDRLIVQVAGYYNQTKQDIEDYEDMNYTVLEDMVLENIYSTGRKSYKA